MQETNSKKVPQIILNGKFIGDYNDLLEHFDDE
jgi:glutaredoxin